jgi:hypothetical protein
MSRYDEREYFEQLIREARLARSKALGDLIAKGFAKAGTFIEGLQASLQRYMAAQHLWHGVE